jgi:EmrB/QacA subfamily drug resistance transporter
VPTDPATFRGPSSNAVPWLVAVALFMQTLDGHILNNALPAMASDLGVAPLRMQPVIIAYLLTTAVFIPISGALADRFGIRRIFGLSIVVFTVGSLACALSGDLRSLVGARILQGLGGALMVPVGRLVLVKAYSGLALIKALSLVSVPSMLGPICGPLLGGALVQYASWRWIFLINLPVGLLGLLLSLRHMPDLRRQGPTAFDLAGFMVFSLSLAVLSLGLESASGAGPSPAALAAVGLGALLMGCYWMALSRRRGAVIEAALFERPGFGLVVCGNLFSRTGSGAMPFMLPIFLQLSLGLSPVRAGLLMAPQAVGSLIGKGLVPPFLSRLGFRRFILGNTIALGLVVSSFSLVGPLAALPGLAALLMLYGIINSMQFTALNSMVLVGLDDERSASGSTLLSVITQICSNSGVTMGAALLGLFALAGGGGLQAVAPGADASMFQKSFFVIGLVILASSLSMRKISANYGGSGRSEGGVPI